MEVSISLPCLFVHELHTLQNYSSVLQFHFFCGSLRTDHRVIPHIRVGLTQAHFNNMKLQMVDSTEHGVQEDDLEKW